MGFKKKSNLIFFLLGSVIVSILLTMQSLFFPLSNKMDFNDSSIYQYIGYLITTGRVPYVDAFDHKGIYFYFINALGYLINPKWGMWLPIAIAMFLSILIVYHTSRKFLDSRFSLIVSAIIASGISASFWDGDTPDYFAMLFVFISFDALADYFVSNSLSHKAIILAGISTAIAFWMKPNMIIGVIVLCGCLIIDFIYSRKYDLISKSFICFFGGFIIASLPALAWLFSKHALCAMFRDYFLFNFVYSSFYAEGINQINAFSYFIKGPAILIAVLCLFFVLCSLLVKKELIRRTSNNLMLLIGSITLVICLLSISLPGNRYENYGTLLYPPLMYTYICTIKHTEIVFDRKRKAIPYLTILVALLIIGLNSYKEINHCKYFWKEVPQETEAMEYILNNSSSNDTIAVISPYYSGLYLATGRESATKDIYIQLGHFENYKRKPESETKFWTEYSSQILAAKPRIIIMDRDYSDIDGLASLLEVCMKDYQYTGKSSIFEFYVLPYYSEETLQDYVTKCSTDKESLLKLSVTQDMVDAYNRGEISMDFFMDLFDEAWKSVK